MFSPSIVKELSTSVYLNTTKLFFLPIQNWTAVQSKFAFVLFLPSTNWDQGITETFTTLLRQRNIPLNIKKAANLRIHLKKNSLFNISHRLLEVFSWLLLDSKERLSKTSCGFLHQVSVALYLVSYMNLRNFNPIFPFKTSKRKLKRLDAE